ncbi:nascent polypeptide-associated complex subunit alpha-like protein 1 isoform X2 [Amaranthus tricolor]|nr:nascent polypeptide-associated complex subunit alpha-like protein 1 isoform X2 [Amaranthus tricolor]
MIEDIDEEDDNTDDDSEDDVEVSSDGDASDKSTIISKSEKKTRKAMRKLGMHPITGVSRVTLRNEKNDLKVISKPVVFMCPTTETYIFFGEATKKDISSQLEIQPAQQFKAPDLSNVIFKPDISAMVQDDAKVYEAGLLPKDVEDVMTQAGVTWGEAFTALKANNGDIMDAIMDLCC